MRFRDPTRRRGCPSRDDATPGGSGGREKGRRRPRRGWRLRARRGRRTCGGSIRRTSGGRHEEHREVPWCAHHAPTESLPHPLPPAQLKRNSLLKTPSRLFCPRFRSQKWRLRSVFASFPGPLGLPTGSTTTFSTGWQAKEPLTAQGTSVYTYVVSLRSKSPSREAGCERYGPRRGNWKLTRTVADRANGLHRPSCALRLQRSQRQRAGGLGNLPSLRRLSSRD